jgi:phenylacetate-CoA ligase
VFCKLPWSTSPTNVSVVATGLTNYAMPLIRYNTGDISSYVHEKCACGRDYPLLRGVEGRLANAYIVGRNGQLITTTGLQGHTRLLDCVERYQLYQDTEGEVALNIIKKETFSDKDFSPILAEFRNRLGDDVKIEVRVVDDIPLTGRGKLNYLVQKLPVKIDDI